LRFCAPEARTHRFGFLTEKESPTDDSGTARASERFIVDPARWDHELREQASRISQVAIGLQA